MHSVCTRDRVAAPNLAIVLLLLGCAAERQVADPVDTYRTASVALEVTIGAADGPDEYLFHSITDLLVTRDGDVWVLDGWTPVGGGIIRRYDAEGSFLGHVGRSGEGPGEYRQPYAMAQFPDGRVIVRDQGMPNRLNVYGPDGSAETAWISQTPLYGIPGAATSLQTDISGVLWLQVVDGRPRPGGRESFYVRLGNDGSVIDTVWAPQVVGDSIMPPPVVEVQRGATVYTFAVPFQPSTFRAWSPFGLFAVGVTSEYSVDLLPPLTAHERRSGASSSRSREPAAQITRHVAPVPVSEGEREAHRRHLRSQVLSHGGLASTPIPEIPSVKPPVRGIRFDLDGRMWILVSVPSDRVDVAAEDDSPDAQSSGDVGSWRQSNTFEVFEADSFFMGRVALPLDSCNLSPRTMRIVGDVVWCVVRDGYGTEAVRRYRVEWSEPETR